LITTFRTSLFAGSVALVLAANGSGAVAAGSFDLANEAARPAAAKVKAANQSLETVTELLGRAVTDRALRQDIRAVIAKRATPDKAVTFGVLSKSSSLRQELVDTYRDTHRTSATEAQSAVDELLAGLPQSQVSVPVRFGSWNAADVAPLVAYVPVGINDMDLKTVTAYDAEGRAYELDAWKEPQQPVIVIGPDETAAHEPSAPSATKLTHRKSNQALVDCYNVRLEYVRLWNDHEPWALGMAETMMVAKSDGVWFKDQFPYLEMDGDQVWPRLSLGCTRNDVRFYWWEDDSGSADFDLKLGAFSFGVNMANDDDLIGGRQLNYSLFAGDSEDTTDFTDLVQVTQ